MNICVPAGYETGFAWAKLGVLIDESCSAKIYGSSTKVKKTEWENCDSWPEVPRRVVGQVLPLVPAHDTAPFMLLLTSTQLEMSFLVPPVLGVCSGRKDGPKCRYDDLCAPSTYLWASIRGSWRTRRTLTHPREKCGHSCSSNHVTMQLQHHDPGSPPCRLPFCRARKSVSH